MHPASGLYSALAVAALVLYALCISWVVCGAFVTRSRPILQWLHIGSLTWGIFTELLPSPCPMTVLENWLEGNAGVEPYQGGFLLHYLDKLVYPNIFVDSANHRGRICLCSEPRFLRSADVECSTWITAKAPTPKRKEER